MMILLRNSFIVLFFISLFGCVSNTQKKSDNLTNAVDTKNASTEGQIIARSYTKTDRLFMEDVKNGNYQQIKKMLLQGANINIKDAEGWTPLHQASINGHTDIAKLLIQKGAIIDAKEIDLRTPLMVAAVNGHTSLVKLLIEQGADVTVKDVNGITPLHGAAVNGYSEIATLLLKKGADVNVEDDNGMTPLLMALSVNRTDMAKLLKQNDANLKLKNPGKVSGLVKDALTGKQLSGASVKIFHQSNILLKVEKTNDYGHYNFILSEGNYILEISLTDYIPVKVNINVTHKETTTITSVRQVPQTWSSKGIVSGQLLNAFNGKAVSNATLKIRSGINMNIGAVVATTTSNNNGNYRVNLPGGNYTIEAIKNGYTTVYFPIVSIGKHTTDNQNASITPTMKPGEIRIVLSWGAEPMDLDSYLLTPNIDGKSYNINHNLRGKWSSVPYVQLDVDDTTSYGPETITIYKTYPGIYYYHVHNYNGNPALTVSNAKVTIFSATGLIKSYNVPLSGSGKYWNVFSYNGSSGKITTIDKIVSTKPK